MNPVKQFGSLQNMWLGNSRSADPAVGIGATEVMWTDRQAFTVVQVKGPGRIVVQRDQVTRRDGNGMSDAQAWDFEPDPEGERVELRLTGDGWRGRGGKRYGRRFTVGVRCEYFDFGF